MIQAANNGLRPTTSWLHRSIGDSEQIRFATPSPRSSLARISARLLSLCSLADMLGSKVEPLALDRFATRVSAKTYRPEGVVIRFKVALDEISPAVDNRIRRLFAKEFCRSTLADEMVPVWP